MKIIKIKVFKKKVKILLDEYFKSIELTYDAYSQYYLYVGKEISKEEYRSILRAESNCVIIQWATKYLHSHDSSEYNFKQKLKAKGIEYNKLEHIVSYMKKKGLINDLSYALRIKEFYQSKNYGKYFVMHRLYQKGIGQDVISQIFFDEEKENERLKTRFAEICKNLIQQDGYINKRKAFNFLCRAGFDSEKALDVLNSQL